MNNNLMHSKCARLKTQFQNIDINYLNQDASVYLANTDLFNDRLPSDFDLMDGTKKKLFWIKFNYESEIGYCKLCNTVHSTFAQTESKIDHMANDNLNLIERINNTALFKLNTSIDTRKQDKNEEFQRIFMQLKEKLDLLEHVLENFIDFSNNYELKLSKRCDLIKQKILNSVENRLISELTENRSKIFSDLNNYQQKCIKNVDVDSSKYHSFKSFLSKHQIDGKTVSYYLNQEPKNIDNSLIEEINFFKAQLDERVANFNSYIFMDKKISFLAKFSTDMEQYMSGLVNFTEFMPKCKQETNTNLIDSYEHIVEVLNKKRKNLEVTNILEFGNEITRNNEKLNLSCHLTGSSDELLICSRYSTKSNSFIYTNCDLYLYDLDGELIRQTSITNCHVRQIVTTSKFILLTAEYEQKLNFSINKLFNTKCFELILYNFNLVKVKSIKVESNLKTEQSLFYPQCLCMDRDKIYMMKNIAPFISVYDMDLNLIAKFGQDFSKQFSYYMTPFNVQNIRALGNKLYLQRINSDHTSYIIIMDLFTGITLKKVNVPYLFLNFYLIKNEIIFLDTNTNDLVLYNFDSETTNAATTLKVNFDEKDSCDEGNDKRTVDSYCLTNSGYVVCLFSELSLIGVF